LRTGCEAIQAKPGWQMFEIEHFSSSNKWQCNHKQRRY
jgi:hypothetical protein